MKNIDKVDLTKLKSKVKKRPLYFCKCGLSKRLPYCDGRHGCEPAAGNEKDNNNGGCGNKLN
jgi:CDGSH-type Zn-finger protein